MTNYSFRVLPPEGCTFRFCKTCDGVFAYDGTSDECISCLIDLEDLLRENNDDN